MRLKTKEEFDFAKPQLLETRSFVSYCRDSYIDSGKKLSNVNQAFLVVTIKDEFLSPVFIEESSDKNISYVSPF